MPFRVTTLESILNVLPDKPKPVPAAYVPAPAVCVNTMFVEPMVMVSFVIVNHLSALVLPSRIGNVAEISSAPVSPSVVLVSALPAPLNV